LHDNCERYTSQTTKKGGGGGGSSKALQQSMQSACSFVI
jgi:hypothetical protein